MKRRTFILTITAILAALVGVFTGMRIPDVKKQAQTPPSRAKKIFEWKMVTSWPAGAPGTGRTAERLAKRITTLSENQIKITVYAAGDLVGGLEVFDAVSRGIAALGHSASFFWQGKTALSPFFTAVPFGLNPAQHHCWLYEGGGQKLWDEVYADFGLKPLAAGNTGPSMGGWFKKPIGESSSQSLAGIKFRMPGLGGKVIKELGALPVSIPPSEIFPALQSGAIDAAELLAPWNDRAFGLHRAAKYCYYPGFHEPNGSAELLINRAAYESLPVHLQAVIQESCCTENIIGLAESDWFNAVALKQLREEGIQFIAYSEQLLNRLQEVSKQVVYETATQSDLGRRLYNSYDKARTVTSSWGEVQKLPPII